MSASTLLRMKNKLSKAALKQFREWGRQGGLTRRDKIGPERCKQIAALARSKKKTIPE